MYKDYLKSLPVPKDHSRQVNAYKICKSFLGNYGDKSNIVLDLGCGEGDSIDFFRNIDPDIQWFGLDLESSPEVNRRERQDATFLCFDGINIPFNENYFDIIFCQQVLEHVRHPSMLLKEVVRVLKPGGYFLGSTSQLEPYHSFSTWNYTPYGFHCLLTDAGMNLQEVRPSIDALTLIIRAGLGRPAFFSRCWEKESPLNLFIELVGRLTHKNSSQINFAKLMFCGQFCFVATK
ncbi:MAG: class I SAM-dependent methyltransferase [Cyanobacteria bacterium P01_D01_bin.156]